MFKVGDIVRVVGGRHGDRYKVISVSGISGMELVLRSINFLNDSSKNFNSIDNGHLVLDKTYERKKKIDKILDNIDSLNIMEKAEALVELDRRYRYRMFMELRINKIKKICSKLEIR